MTGISRHASWMAPKLLSQVSDNCKTTRSEDQLHVFFKEVKISRGQMSDICDHRLTQTPKEAFSEVRAHAGTAKVDFEVDGQPPADSPTGDNLITMVNGKKIFEK